MAKKSATDNKKLTAAEREEMLEAVTRSMPKPKGGGVMKVDVSVLPKVNLEDRRGANGGGGGVRKLDMQQWAELIGLYNSGWSVSAIAERFHITRNTVYNYLKTAAKLQQA